MGNQRTSTLVVDKETQHLIRQYCFIHKINMKNFVEELANEKLDVFKKRLDELRRIRI